MPSPENVTELLVDWSKGALDKLMPLVYSGYAGWLEIICGENARTLRCNQPLW